MSKTTKRKHVAREVLEDFVTLNDAQVIAKIVAGRGNNLHEVSTATGNTFLASMPVKFRKNVWIKRGDYVVIEPIEEGGKVKAEIIRILYKDQIRHLKHQHLWPSQFDDEAAEVHSIEVCGEDKNINQSDADESDGDELFVNTNRTTVLHDDDDDDENDSDSDENQ